MITFDAATHTYTDTATGLVIPGVTTVIRGAGLMDGEEFFTEEARARGTAVHLACQYFDEGDLEEGWIDSSPHGGYVRAWQRFRAEAPFAPALIEHRVSSPLGYAGTLDRTGVLGGGEVVNALIDIKTGAPQRWHAIQTAAYAGTFHHPRKYRRITVHLGAEGSYSLREHPAADYTENFSVFIAALKIFQWRHSGSTSNPNRAAA